MTSSPPEALAAILHPSVKLRRYRRGSKKTRPDSCPALTYEQVMTQRPMSRACSNYTSTTNTYGTSTQRLSPQSSNGNHVNRQISQNGSLGNRRHSSPPSSIGSLSRQGSCNSLSSIESTSSDLSSPANWPEYAVRKSLVKFRNRRSAQRWSGRRKLTRAPSNTIKRVLDNVYSVSKDERATPSTRMMAVLYSWFYGWIIDVYYLLTDEGRERSFMKWALSSILVTCAAMVLMVLAAFALYHINFFMLTLMNAGLYFSTTLLVSGIGVLGFLAVLNYD